MAIDVEYWNDINNADIGIYNSQGLKIAGNEQISIDKKSSINGILTWNCSNANAGVYFIYIKLKTAIITIKAIVVK